MKKKHYIDNLRNYLSYLSEEERVDIIRDQEEYINDAIKRGRSEAEVITALGDPKILANSLLAESKIHVAEKTTSLSKQVSGTLNAAVAIIALTPLNIFFVIIPLSISLLLLILGWTAAIGILVAALVLLSLFLSKLVFTGASLWALVSFFFFSLGLLGVGLLAILLFYKITRFFLQFVLTYLKWNLNFIKNKFEVNYEKK